MARKSRMSIMKRQREVQKADKAARKRAKRQGKALDIPLEPMPTVSLAEPGEGSDEGASSADEADVNDPPERP